MTHRHASRRSSALASGTLRHPGLTHATILSEEAAYINYAFETTIRYAAA